MKVTLHIKHGDAVYEGAREAVEDTRPEGLSDNEWDDVRAMRVKEVYTKLEKWVEYCEYITVEIDLDTMTATVKEL